MWGGSLRSFALDGWQVYAFEPDAVNRPELEKMCAHLDNVTIDSRAVSNEILTDQPYYQSDVSSGISGLSAFYPSHKEVGRVSTITLDKFCQGEGITAIDFLKIDTEGFDLFVLNSVPWDRIEPRLIVCEFEDRKTVPLGYTYHDMASYLVDHGYEVMVSEWYPIVEYGQRHKWRRFFPYPGELANTELGHGNLIATLVSADMARLEEITKGYKET